MPRPCGRVSLSFAATHDCVFLVLCLLVHYSCFLNPVVGVHIDLEEEGICASQQVRRLELYQRSVLAALGSMWLPTVDQ